MLKPKKNHSQESKKIKKSENRLKPKKKYSQNWLTSPEMRAKIIKKMDILVESYPDLPILEIGPGRLDMTLEIASIAQKYNRKFVAIEVDPEAVDFIQKKLDLKKNDTEAPQNTFETIPETENNKSKTDSFDFENLNYDFLQTENLKLKGIEKPRKNSLKNGFELANINEIETQAELLKKLEKERKYQILKEIDFELVYGDALEMLASGPSENNQRRSVVKKNQEFFKEMDRFILFSSLPYSVGSRILVEMCQNHPNPFLVICQKEVGKKMLNRELNLLGGFLSIYFDIKYHFDIASGCFFPKPKVTSCLVEGRPV